MSTVITPEETLIEGTTATINGTITQEIHVTTVIQGNTAIGATEKDTNTVIRGTTVPTGRTEIITVRDATGTAATAVDPMGTEEDTTGQSSIERTGERTGILPRGRTMARTGNRIGTRIGTMALVATEEVTGTDSRRNGRTQTSVRSEAGVEPIREIGKLARAGRRIRGRFVKGLSISSTMGPTTTTLPILTTIITTTITAIATTA